MAERAVLEAWLGLATPAGSAVPPDQTVLGAQMGLEEQSEA